MEKRTKCLVVMLCAVGASLLGLVLGFVALANALDGGAVKSYKCLDEQCLCTKLVADCSYRDVRDLGPIPETVKVLKLSFTQDTFCRRITVDGDTTVLANLTHIESLYLIACELKRIPKLPDSVTKVDLSHNPLGHLGPVDLRNLSPGTVSLALSNCDLTHVALGSFQALPLLQRLDLSYNYFPQVRKSGVTPLMLQKLDYLDLSFNEDLICDEDAALLGYYVRSRPYAFLAISGFSAPTALHREYRCWNQTNEPHVRKSIPELPFTRKLQTLVDENCTSGNPEAWDVSHGSGWEDAGVSSRCGGTVPWGPGADWASIYLLGAAVIFVVGTSLIVAVVYLALRQGRKGGQGYQSVSQFS